VHGHRAHAELLDQLGNCRRAVRQDVGGERIVSRPAGQRAIRRVHHDGILSYRGPDAAPGWEKITARACRTGAGRLAYRPASELLRRAIAGARLARKPKNFDLLDGRSRSDFGPESELRLA
jgi:hypothetical protein